MIVDFLVIIINFKWILSFSEIDNELVELERIEDAQIIYPLIITKDNKKVVILDGAHRLGKAIVTNVENLPCKYITSKELKTCLIK